MRWNKEELKPLPAGLAFLAIGFAFIFAPRIAMIIIASVFFLLAILCTVEACRLARAGRRVQGLVVDHAQEEGCFLPVVEFRDDSGEIRRHVTKTGGGVKSPKVGCRVVVLYDPANKFGCEIDTFWRRWGFSLALTVLGVVFGVGAVAAQK